MLAELLTLDGVREAIQLSPLDLLRLRRVSSPLRAFANTALAECTPLMMLGVLEDQSPLPQRRQAEPSQLALLAGGGDGGGDADDDDEDFQPSSEEDDGEADGGEADDGEAGSSDAGESSEDDEAAAHGGDTEQALLRLRGLVMCWSSGRWAAAPALDCGSDQTWGVHPCHVVGPAPEHWPPRRECLVFTHTCEWAFDYTVALTAGTAAAARAAGVPLPADRLSRDRLEGIRGRRADGAAVVWGRMPAREAEILNPLTGYQREAIGSRRFAFMLGGYYELPSDSVDEDEDEDHEEEGHCALVEYFPLDALDDAPRLWTRMASMEEPRTDFAAGFFPAGSRMAENAMRRSPYATSYCGALIVAGGSDGSDEEYLRSVEFLCVVVDPDDTHELICSCWSKLPDMLHPRGYCTGCALPDGRFVVMGGRSRRSTGPTRRRDGEVFDPSVYRWRALPPLPAVFGESPELTLCAAGPSLLIAAMALPEELGGKRFVAALRLAALPARTKQELQEDLRGEHGWWQARVAQAAAEERWVTLGALPQGGGGGAEEARSLVCIPRQ